MILSQTQAEATYRSMCEIGRVDGTLRLSFGPYDDGQHVDESINKTGVIHVFNMCRGTVFGQETYANQSAFAAAYGLQKKLTA